MKPRQIPLLVALLGVGCQQGKDSPETQAPPKEQPETQVSEEPEPGLEQERPAGPDGEDAAKPTSKDGFFVADGAPEPQACKTAEDCLGDTVPDVDNPCCQNPTTLRPYAREYKTWVADWRKDNCSEVECPPPPNPSLPPDCAFKVECVEGTCADTCP